MAATVRRMIPGPDYLPQRNGEWWRTSRTSLIACSRCKDSAVTWPVVSWHMGRSTWLVRLECQTCGTLQYVPATSDQVSGFGKQFGAWHQV